MSSCSICSLWSFSSPGFVGGVDEKYLLLHVVLEELIYLNKSITEDPAASSLLDELHIISKGTDDENEQPAGIFNSAAVGNRSVYFVKCKLVCWKQYQTLKCIVLTLSLQCRSDHHIILFCRTFKSTWDCMSRDNQFGGERKFVSTEHSEAIDGLGQSFGECKCFLNTFAMYSTAQFCRKTDQLNLNIS